MVCGYQFKISLFYLCLNYCIIEFQCNYFAHQFVNTNINYFIHRCSVGSTGNHSGSAHLLHNSFLHFVAEILRPTVTAAARGPAPGKG